MNIIVFGATGRFGPHIVERLLEEGHRVTAFVRTPAKVQVTHPMLLLWQGDVRDASVVSAALVGQEAVIEGVAADNDPELRSQAVANIIAGMKQAGVRRVIGLGGAGALHLLGHYFYELPIFPKSAVPVSIEHRKVYEVLLASGLDWTMVCLPFLVSAPATHRYMVRAERPFLIAKQKLPMADAADFIAHDLNSILFPAFALQLRPAEHGRYLGAASQSLHLTWHCAFSHPPGVRGPRG